jgi:RHS repeat-associated protein
VIRSTDAKGQTTHYEYDLLGRLVRRIDAGGITHAWQWDATHATGRLASRSRPGFAEAYAYDAGYGRLARVDTQVNVSGVWVGAQSRELGYDAAGRLATQRFPNGQVVGYDYSSTGHLQRVTSGATVLHDWRATDAFGSPVEERFHNGALRTARSYDPANGLLTSIRSGTSVAPGAIQDLETAWRTNRTLYRRIDRRNTTSTTDDYVDTISYDAVDRVTRQATSGGAARMLDFSYAANGNLTGRSSATPGDALARDFVHGNPAQPYRLTGVTLGGVANTLAYDANGNVVRYSPSSGPSTWLRYDARNNVTRITIGHDEAIGEARDEFWYDPDGHRFLSRETWDEGGVSMSRSVLYLGADYEETRFPAGADHDVVQRIQVSPAARIVRRRHAETGAWTVAHEYLHRDHLGSVETVTNGAGVVLARYSFDPFGTHRATHRASDLRADGFAALLGLEVTQGARGFTGHEHRNRTGFIHMNGRVYDPRIGRFVSPDPMVQAPWTGQGFNRYAYVMNSPLSYVDPTGRCGTETGFQLTPCRGFDEHVRVIGVGSGGGGFFGSLNSEGGGFGIQVPGGIGGIGGTGAGGFLTDVEALLRDFLADRQAQAEETPADRQATEVVSVTADRPAGQDRDDMAGGWILRVLENLNGVGIRSLFGSGCAGIILGGCGAISVDSSTGAVHAMFMLGVIPGAGFSVGSEATLFSSDFQSSSGYGTALFATGGASGIGGSLGIAQGTNGFSVTGAAGYGFGFGGGLGFYYAMPVGSLAK